MEVTGDIKLSGEWHLSKDGTEYRYRESPNAEKEYSKSELESTARFLSTQFGVSAHTAGEFDALQSKINVIERVLLRYPCVE